MGFVSLDDLVTEVTGGKFWRADWNKITGSSAYTSGRWYDLSILAGTPPANAYSGTAITATALTDTSTGALWHGGNVTADTKPVLNAGPVTTAATGAPSTLLFVDILLFYPGVNMNSNSLQSFTNVTTLPRYTTGDGVRAFLVISGATGSTAHNIAISYTDQAGNSGASLPVTVAGTASAIVGHITHSGVAASNYGPFLPLAAGDYGIRSVESLQLSAATGSASTAVLVLCRPLFSVPIFSSSVYTERDYLNQLPSLPKIEDGAYIGILQLAGANTAANTSFYGYVEFGWG